MKNKNKWHDHYARKAKASGYPARSVYKLKEIQSKYKLIHEGDRILDLGCSPGSWLLYLSEIVGEKGSVAGVDKEDLNIEKLPQNTNFYKTDIKDLGEEIKKPKNGFDLVVSDMSPKTTGIKDVDSARSFELGELAFKKAKSLLKQGGSFICKFLEGEELDDFLPKIKKEFERVKNLKPKSSRKNSKEIFLIAIGYKK